MQKAVQAAECMPISVVIPTLNEAERLPAVLAKITGIPAVEVIVVDGGSDDGTAEVASRYPCRVLQSIRGRAAQMNCGAAAATGTAILFLHADTRLPDSFPDLVRKTLRDPKLAGGAFTLRIDAQGFGLRTVEWFANLRSRWLKLPYGDQAIFLRRDTFESAGRYRELPILEDYLLIRKLKRLGPLHIVNQPAVTSARRWIEKGLLRTTLINQAIVIGYYLGVSPQRLARWYGRS